jgi:hypothetical protein
MRYEPQWDVRRRETGPPVAGPAEGRAPAATGRTRTPPTVTAGATDRGGRLHGPAPTRSPAGRRPASPLAEPQRRRGQLLLAQRALDVGEAAVDVDRRNSSPSRAPAPIPTRSSGHHAALATRRPGRHPDAPAPVQARVLQLVQPTATRTAARPLERRARGVGSASTGRRQQRRAERPWRPGRMSGGANGHGFSRNVSWT